MANDEMKQIWKVPEPTLRRLPWYLAFLKLMKGRGETFVSSTQIAKEINVDPSQVAKDLSFVNISGKTRVGYEIGTLVDVLEDFLGFTAQHKAFLFGVGSLGAALLQDSGLKQYGLEIVGGFDVRRELAGTEINGIPVYHMDDFPAKQKEYGATIGVITVPVDKAQEVTELIIAGGIKALWNFTPFRIRVPEDIVVQNTSMYAHLAVMFNRLNSQLITEMKIIAVGMNYAEHNKELHHSLELSEPTIFMKSDSSLLKDGKPFFIPDFSSEIHYETEIVVKIDRLGKNIAERFAHRYYNEVTVGIDFTARDLQNKLRAQGLPWEISKAFDNSAVLGTFVPLERVGDVNRIPFHLDINGKTVQEGNTQDMLFPVDKIIAYVSRFFTLKIGDLIYTGTPVGVGPVKIDDHLQGYIGEQKLLDFFVR